MLVAQVLFGSWEVVVELKVVRVLFICRCLEMLMCV